MRRTCALICVALIAASISAGCHLWNPSDPSDGPPDPGEAGKRTIEGVDSDGDGVRDDVQRYILQANVDAPTRDAMSQFARAMTEGMVAADVGADDAVMVRLEEVGAAVDCLSSVQPDSAGLILTGLEALMTNTRVRAEAYEAMNARAGGETFVLPDDLAAGCQ